MQALIQNYANANSSESLYMTECINSMDGCKAVLWGDQNVSVFDIFDSINPTTFFTHYSLITNDLVKYLSGSNIECIFNVTEAQQEHIDQLDTMLLDNKIKCPFIFTNHPRQFNALIQRKTKLLSVMHGADIFLPKQALNIPDYKLEAGIVTDYKPDGGRLSSLSAKYATHHIISSDPELSEHVDLISPTTHMYALYPKYQKTIITQSKRYLPQCLFDSILYGNETYYLTRNEGQQEKTSEVLKAVFRTKESLVRDEDGIQKGGANFGNVRSRLIEGHTCVSRVKRIMARLKCNASSHALDKLLEEYSHD